MPDPTPRPDVPDEWVTLAQQADTAHARTRRPDGAGWARATDGQVRRIIAAVAPLIARQAREQVAAEIEARVAEHRATAARLDEGDRADRLEAIGWHAKADHLQEGAEIARGEGR